MISVLDMWRSTGDRKTTYRRAAALEVHRNALLLGLGARLRDALPDARSIRRRVPEAHLVSSCARALRATGNACKGARFGDRSASALR